MQITLYNTCPTEYEKKFIQILKKIIGPALKQGRSVRVVEVEEDKKHIIRCNMLNSKVRNSYMKKCGNCPPRTCNQGYYSDTTMKISIT